MQRYLVKGRTNRSQESQNGGTLIFCTIEFANLSQMLCKSDIFKAQI